ncbi:unnamed protein product [Caretta caretta]
MGWLVCLILNLCHLEPLFKMIGIWIAAFYLLDPTAGEKVCYQRLGCFSDKPPWAGIPGRFLGGLPDSPESMDISFTLYTKETRNNSQVISAIHPSTIKDSHFCSHRKTRFIVHGFMSTGKRGWVVKMCLLLVEVEDVNCIAVDWAEGAKGIYISAVNNIRVVGAEIAYFINTLMKMFRYCPSHIHIIGHSLGAHVAGDAGRRIRGIKRITGLDPAGPLFEGTPPKVRLDPTDARFVDVIHSNAAQFPTVGAGIVNTSGHLDFYPNGGSIMPGCDDVIIPSKKGWSHKISIKLSGTKKVRGELNIVFHGTDRFTKQYQIICGLLHQGNIYTKYVDVEINPRNITKIEFLWNKNIFTLLWAQLGAEMVHVINEEDGHVSTYCGNGNVKYGIPQLLTPC